MTTYRIRGPHGHVTSVQVPGPGVSESTFKDLVDSGEWTIVPDEPTTTPAPKKRAPRKPAQK